MFIMNIFENLPEQYTPLYYIENNDGQAYIDTGIYGTQNTSILADVHVVDFITHTYCPMIGFYSSTDSLTINPGTGSTTSRRGTVTISNAFKIAENTRNVFENLVSNTKLNGSFTGTWSSVKAFVTSGTLWIGRCNGSAARAHTKIYECIIWEGEEKIRHFVPCINPEGVVGMYDSINEIFYSSVETSQFTAGTVAPIKKETGNNIVRRSLNMSYVDEGLPKGTVFDFKYTGTVQSVELPKGKYKLQCWGAQGGNVTGTYAVNGSKGGYSEGVLTLTKTTTLYIFVGGQGTAYTSSASQTSTSVVNGGWNGGGAGKRTSRYNSAGVDGRSFPRGGGGGTDIALVTSAMSVSSGITTRDSASLLSRIIVAGGGAGASAYYKTEITYSLFQSGLVSGSKFTPGSDTRYKLENGSTNQSDNDFYLADITWYGDFDGTKNTTVGLGEPFDIPLGTSYGIITSDPADYIVAVYAAGGTTSSSGKATTVKQGGGTSGRGQYPGTQTSAAQGGAFGLGASQSRTNYRYCSGGGGGGWYGGGSQYSDSSTSYINYTGGGSGFVNTSANASSRPSGYTGLQLDSGTTIAGNTSFESPTGGTETGHSGNGYARITVI